MLSSNHNKRLKKTQGAHNKTWVYLVNVCYSIKNNFRRRIYGAKLVAKPGKEALLAEMCKSIVKEVSEKEEGCLMYIPHVSVDNPAEIIFMEKYVDQAALDAHLQTPYFKALAAQFSDVLAEKLSLQFMEELA